MRHWCKRNGERGFAPSESVNFCSLSVHARGPMPTDNARQTGPALEHMQRFLLWLVPTVEKFPRSQKFTLGDRIQTTALDVLERLVEATYTKARAKSLQAANLGIEKLRILIRLATELKIMDLRR